MTNEEIFKYADKALKNEEKRYNSLVSGTLLLFIFGMVLMYIPVGSVDIVWASAVLALFWFITFILYLYIVSKYTSRYAKVKREFAYNLVRKDERMRIEGKK